MKGNKSTPKPTPYLLFVSGVLSERQGASSIERAKGYNLALFRKIFHHPKIREAIMRGDILVIPAMINDRTRDLEEILSGLGAF
jgi:hypothetical protein